MNTGATTPCARQGPECDVTPPTPVHSRIFSNDRGTFYTVADSHYWAARFAMVGRKRGQR
jgi:hypothetical protein